MLGSDLIAVGFSSSHYSSANKARSSIIQKGYLALLSVKPDLSFYDLDTTDLPSPCNQIELIKMPQKTYFDSFGLHDDQLNIEIIVVSGTYIFWHQVAQRLKCVALKRLKHPIRNVVIQDDLLLVTDTQLGVSLFNLIRGPKNKIELRAINIAS
jgi:hypothetical protein